MTLTEDQDGQKRTAGCSVEPERPIAVSVSRISKTYPVAFLRVKKFLRRRFKPPVEALCDISFDIREGEIFGLIGPNGAGKTTLTKIIATLVQPTSGSVVVKGYDSVRDDGRVRAQVGLATAEERSFYWRLTAEENLLFFARLYGLDEKAALQRIRELLQRFEIEELARRRFGELSTGNKQRLAVARAMLANPPVLLLDEPTRSLDPLAASRMRSLIKSLATAELRVTVLLTSHNLAEVEELCDRVAVIRGGRIRALDTPKNLRLIHTQTEQVLITFTSSAIDDLQRALLALLSDRFEMANGARADEWVLSFSRETRDDMLNAVLALLQHHGAVIRQAETERATLLNVLESYETEPGRDVSNERADGNNERI
ncbi:MAG: type transport system ATP-binding protein [Blastocatellia bacterium]|jgi:ABC-2 type transport system ATP-binding protein|nr:type transport system ATP-binding protein [Blastocatellia bacterium]